MIIIFHCFTNFLYHLFKKHIKERNSSWSNFTITKLNSDLHPLAQRDAENDIKFDPPVYKQRYERATEILMDKTWKNQISKVVDFGCSDFGLFVFLKNLALGIKEISFVDIDELLLRDCLFRVYPLNADHLMRRAQHLTVRVFAGNIADPDPSLLETDVVIALEIIEHLYPDVLDALPYNLFAYIQPKLAVFTTPNFEFNVLFEKLEKFRHADHKFEWDREQFQSWATNITLRFPNYTVLFDGIGFGPNGSEDFGCCSQLAVFIRKDIICDNYLREIIPCVCKDSTCKSLDCLNSVRCYCDCVNCMPKCSYGVCTYSTGSKSLSNRASKEIIEGSNYKLIATIEYPHDDDTRTEEEKVLDEVKYRMHNVGHVYGNYYDAEKNCSLIPLSKLVYKTKDDFPTETQVRNLLLKFNYQIEECLNQETERVETCVIYEPEMENSGSGSDTEASGYESDNNKYAVDDAQLSDWDENDVSWNTPTKKATEVIVDSQGVKTQLHLEVSGSKKQQEALVDSGYQKSPSVPDESPQAMPLANEEVLPLEIRCLSNERPNRLSNILSVFDNFDKINELDAVRKEKKFFNFSSNLPHREVMKKICQEIVKHPIAGPSRDPKRRAPNKKSQSSDSDDSVEDVRSITTCILENSLNKIECKEEEKHRAEVIQELIQEELPPLPQDEIVEPVLVVENGDLANNNRDREGNNYPAEDEGNLQLQNDNAVDNLELNNVNIDNNNEVIEVAPIAAEQAVEEIPDENIDIEPPVDIEVAWSSREALFDVNSQVDLLEDFDMDVAAAVVSGIVIPGSFVVVADASGVANNAVLPPEDGFPNWLLQIFEETETVGAEDDMHDEPHFYCQGDGLGVHPSTVAINDDDDDDEGNESGSDSSSSSSSNGSVDFANAQNATSIQEMFMPPDESRTEESLVVVGQQVTDQNGSISNADTEEVFENAEESESNLVSSSCTQ